MNTNKKFTTLLALVVVFSMLMAAVPAGSVHAAGSAFDGGTWSSATEVSVDGVTQPGRLTVVNYGGMYHLWYSGSSDNTLFHTQSADPTHFPTGVEVSTGDATELSSTAIALEGTTFYMVKYSAGSTQKFSLYTSPVTDGVNWTLVGEVFDGTSLLGIAKIDAPFLFVNGTDIKLYFQTKTNEATPIYKIYKAETDATTLAGLSTAPFTGAAMVLAPSESGLWDDFRVFQPWVVYDGTYHMWYGGYSTSNGTMKIGYATSSDGIAWTKSASNLIIADGAEPTVVKDGNNWHFWYRDSSLKIRYMTFGYTQSIAAVINPAKTTIRHDQTFKVDIVANAPYLYGVQYSLSFDPAKFSAGLATTLGSDGFAVNNVDNVNGKIDFAYTQKTGAAMSDVDNVLATITFTVKSTPTPGTAAIDLTDAKFAGNDGKSLPGTLTMTDATIDVVADTEIYGQVTLQGRPAGPGTFAGTLVTLSSGATFTTLADAQFAFTGLDAGSYTMKAEKNGYLDVVWSAKDIGPQSYIVPTVMLLGGNAIDDTAINNLDLTAIGTDYLTAVNVSGTTDINGDGTVNILDLTMAGVNYEKTTQTIAWES